MEFWGQKTFCLITGASRGIGKCIAIEFAKKFGPNSVLLLIARNESNLEETKNEILANLDCKAKSIQVFTAAIDLVNPDASTYFELITSTLQKSGSTTSANDFQHSILVHNAGSTGNSVRILELENAKEIQDYFAVNITSVIILTSQFFKIFNDKSNQQKRSLIQITSLAAIETFKTLGLYCCGKAARNSLMKNVAAEESISVLCYSPGPVETDMYLDASKNIGDSELRQVFVTNLQDKKTLTCIQTVTKLMDILTEGKYTKAEHVGYFSDTQRKVWMDPSTAKKQED